MEYYWPRWQNSIDKWYDKVEILSDKSILLKESDKYYRKKTLTSPTEECQNDSRGIYSQDGKVLIKPLNKKTIVVREGVERAEGSVIGYDTTTLTFEKGVEHIGSGYGEYYTDKPLTINLPSTIRSIDKSAFRDMATSIKKINVPKGYGETIKGMLSPNLASFVSEGGGLFSGVDINNLLRNPMSELFGGFTSNAFPNLTDRVTRKKLWILVYLLAIIGFGLPGYLSYRDTLLNHHASFQMLIAITIAFGALCSLCALVYLNIKNKSLPPYINIFGVFCCFLLNIKNKLLVSYINKVTNFVASSFQWIGLSIPFCGLMLTCIFFVNDIAGGEPKTMNAEIEQAWEHGKYYSIDIKLPVEPYSISKDIGSDGTYQKGMPCVVNYHTGLFGMDVIDSVEHTK